MPPRLAHTKSRRGCQRCKARRVKCDEVHPSCGACARHGVVCQYPSEPPTAESNSQSHTQNAETTSSPQSGASSNFIETPYSDLTGNDVPQESQERRLTEIFLLHHFTRILPTLPPSFDPGVRDNLMNDVPRLACQHPHLLNVVLALAALHIFYHVETRTSSLTPQLDWATVHRTYLNLAIHQQRHAISELTSMNAEAICWTTLFISYQTLKLLPHSERDVAATPALNYEPPMAWFAMCVPIGQIIRIAMRVLPPEAGIRVLFQTTRPKLSNPQALMTPDQRQNPNFEQLLDYLTFPEYEADQQRVLLIDEDTKEAYEKTLSYIGSIHHGIFRDAEPPLCVARRFLAFAAIIPKHYCVLLEEQRPRALVIFALFAALMSYVDSVWLFTGRAEAELKGIEKVVGSSWKGPMEWIKQLMQQSAAMSEKFT